MRLAAAAVLLAATSAGRALGLRHGPQKPSAAPQASLLQLEADDGSGSISTWVTGLIEPHLKYDAASRGRGPLVDLVGLVTTLVQMIVSAVCWIVLVVAVAFFYLRLKELPPPASGDGVAAPEGKPSDASLSHWKDGCGDCFEEPGICLWACCCPAIRWADTVDLSGLVRFWVALAVFLGLSVANAFLGEVLLWAALAVVCAGFRQEMRRKFGMSQSGSTYVEDCLLYCCCSCCAIAQEARHVEEACRVGHPVVVEALGRRQAEAAGRSSPIVLGPAGAAAPPPAPRTPEEA